MKNVSLLYTFTIILFSILFFDFIYFYFVQSKLLNMITTIQKSPVKVNLVYFVICYFFLTFALYYFVIREKKSPMDAFLLGISIYAVYELTNASLFTKWKEWVIFIDSLWGGILFSSVTYIYYYLTR
jgi:uncharacterized membrane protein